MILLRDPVRLAVLSIFLVSAAMLGLALWVQARLVLGPTILAELARIPFGLAMAISLLATVRPSTRIVRLAVGLCAMVFFVEALLDAYHLGVEHLWFAAPASCGHPMTTAEVQASIGGLRHGRCDFVTGTLLHLSLAGWNLLVSLSLSAICGGLWQVLRRREAEAASRGGRASLFGMAGAVLFAAGLGTFAWVAHEAVPSSVAMPPVGEGDRSLGAESAPITVIEYFSLSCPHCAVWEADVFPRLRQDWIDTGKVRFVLRDYPLNGDALKAAILARCAEPGRYFAVIGAMLAHQPDWAHAQDPVPVLTGLAGLAEGPAQSCLADDTLRTAILTSRLDAEKAGIRQTPTIIVNGRTAEAGPDYDALARQLREVLSAQ